MLFLPHAWQLKEVRWLEGKLEVDRIGTAKLALFTPLLCKVVGGEGTVTRTGHSRD